MPTLQVRDLPEDIYERLAFFARLENRSLAQQTIVFLRDGVERRASGKLRRRQLLESYEGIRGVTCLPDPATLIREDRETR